jgi:hypothetical protein
MPQRDDHTIPHDDACRVADIVGPNEEGLFECGGCGLWARTFHQAVPTHYDGWLDEYRADARCQETPIAEVEPEMPPRPSAPPELTPFYFTWDDDPAQPEPFLVCRDCTTKLCTVEELDDLTLIVLVALDHKCGEET